MDLCLVVIWRFGVWGWWTFWCFGCAREFSVCGLGLFWGGLLFVGLLICLIVVVVIRLGLVYWIVEIWIAVGFECWCCVLFYFVLLLLFCWVGCWWVLFGVLPLVGFCVLLGFWVC